MLKYNWNKKWWITLSHQRLQLCILIVKHMGLIYEKLLLLWIISRKMHVKILFAKWQSFCSYLNVLTHWGRVKQICVSKLTINGSDNGLLPIQRQTIIWTNAGILLIRTLATNFSETLIQTDTFSFKKMHFKMWFGKCRPFCLILNVLIHWPQVAPYSIIVLGQHWFR